MPVERTAKTKLPSREASRASTAFQSSGWFIIAGMFWVNCNIVLHLSQI